MSFHLEDQEENYICNLCILTDADMSLHVRIWVIKDGTDHIFNICIPVTNKKYIDIVQPLQAQSSIV